MTEVSAIVQRLGQSPYHTTIETILVCLFLTLVAGRVLLGAVRTIREILKISRKNARIEKKRTNIRIHALMVCDAVEGYFKNNPSVKSVRVITTDPTNDKDIIWIAYRDGRPSKMLSPSRSEVISLDS